MKRTENQKTSKREEIHIYSLTLKMTTYLVQRSCTVLLHKLRFVEGHPAEAAPVGRENIPLTSNVHW